VLDIPDPKDEFNFHNMFVAPGVTPNKEQNPGVAIFEVTSDGVPHNLRFEFMDIYSQYFSSSVEYSDLKFNSLDMSEYGLTEITAEGLNDLKIVLEED